MKTNNFKHTTMMTSLASFRLFLSSRNLKLILLRLKVLSTQKQIHKILRTLEPLEHFYQPIKQQNKALSLKKYQNRIKTIKEHIK